MSSSAGSSTAASGFVGRSTRSSFRVEAAKACFVDGEWCGFADFLFRVDGVETDLGGWGYEAADAKLAKRPKPYFLVQLCFYSEQVARIQGTEPRRMHVVLGTRERRSFLVADFSAYYRRVPKPGSSTSSPRGRTPTPHPVEHCNVCRWRDHCDEQRVADDHLSLVARIRRDQIGRLNERGIANVHELAQAGDGGRRRRSGGGVRVQRVEEVERGQRGVEVRQRLQRIGRRSAPPLPR